MGALRRVLFVGVAGLVLLAGFGQGPCLAGELSVEDFDFNGELGCEGAAIERCGPNHFKVTLGHAPKHPDWANMCQFHIKQNAKGNPLRLDVSFPRGRAYLFNHYSYSWSYDGVHWYPIHWRKKTTDPKEGDTLVFAEFTEDEVFVGHQVPMSYEDLCELVEEWEKSPFVKVHVIGQSLGGRDIFRLEITDPESEAPRNTRWVHYVTNQHPGEHNSQWRIKGMIDWLLSDEGADCRSRSVCYFVPMMSPDAPSKGWYRVNAEGVDMNRAYFVDGSGPGQAHEARVCQEDLEALMASNTPVTDLWSMHTWQGIVEPILNPGPEMGAAVGPWTDLRDIIEKYDVNDLIKPLKDNKKKPSLTYWTHGPHKQFGITVVLCEGAGSMYTKHESIESGEILMRGIAEYYEGTR